MFIRGPEIKDEWHSGTIAVTNDSTIMLYIGTKMQGVWLEMDYIDSCNVG